MGRSGYSDDSDGDANLYRANVDRAIEGRRGQAFLKEMLAAMDALPEKRLLSEVMQNSGEVCAIGSVGRARGTDMTKLDPENYEEWDFAGAVAQTFGIATPMAAEIMHINDIGIWHLEKETPEQRFMRVRQWIVDNIKPEKTSQ
jgi:hypothetical protein